MFATFSNDSESWGSNCRALNDFLFLVRCFFSVKTFSFAQDVIDAPADIRFAAKAPLSIHVVPNGTDVILEKINRFA